MAEPTKTHKVWMPLFDQPIIIQMSREQLQGIQNALLGRKEAVGGWGAWFGRTEIERILRESIDDCSAPVPSGGVQA